jgi:hypothetical protein
VFFVAGLFLYPAGQEVPMKNVLLLLALSLALSACGPATVTVGPAYPAHPVYVETWPGGGCWADDVWYASCPWYVGPQAGYYYRHDSHWYIQPAPRVRRHHHHPPPRVRDHRRPSRHHMVPPPRVRDHRHRR